MRGWRTALWILVSVCAAAPAGCGRDAATADKPPRVAYGEDVCVACGMIISDPRYAAALVVEREAGDVQRLLFDDVGEMVVYEAEHPALKILRRWVHDAARSVEQASADAAWLDAEQAWCVKAPTLQTPMATGIAAYATKEAAQRAAAEHAGVVRRYAELVQERRSESR